MGWLGPITTGLGQAGAGFSVLYCRKATVRLFKRSGRDVVLTEDGQRLEETVVLVRTGI
ncbi:hypothetical protein [Leisingera aquimarina]|uniref:hypothetical protein n=1 Tax=Leisingera aquimarina TaxID=476529 RepID=UPI000421B68F|nr:hypothetical protein [Leisingera aquimarina]